MTANDDNLVWSDERGGAVGGSPSKRKRKPKTGKGGGGMGLAKSGFPDDGVVRVCREKSGRGGKTVTVLYGVPAAERKPLLKQLKAGCGCGGTLRGAFLEIQGDHRDKILSVLENRGLAAKAAGG